MKTSNYLAKLPQEATIKSIQVLKDYDLISLDVPTASQRPVLTAALTTVLSRTPVPYRLSGTSPVTMALRLFLVFLLFSPVFLISSPVYLEELLSFLGSPQSFSLSWCPPDFSQLFSFFWCS